MNRTVLNVILAGILAVLAGIAWFGARDYQRPNYEFMPNMVHTARYNSFAPNPNFANGQTLQTPPPHTIPYGTTWLPYRATTQDAVRAGNELANPFSATKSIALERGAVLFNRFCLPCHGPAGAGDGPVAKRGFPPPPALFADHARQMKDGQIFHIITFGQGNMPSHAAQINANDRWRIVLRVRQLQEQAAAASAKIP
jgi:mono/diheme cytochrome c family protein